MTQRGGNSPGCRRDARPDDLGCRNGEIAGEREADVSTCNDTRNLLHVQQNGVRAGTQQLHKVNSRSSLQRESTWGRGGRKECKLWMLQEYIKRVTVGCCNVFLVVGRGCWGERGEWQGEQVKGINWDYSLPRVTAANEVQKMKLVLRLFFKKKTHILNFLVLIF